MNIAKPLSAAEAAAGNLLPPGVYDFEIAEASEEVSKNTGADMIKLKVTLFNDSGDRCGSVFDYLLESVAYKIRNAAEACGMLDNYEAGHLHADEFVGKTGRAKISIRKDKNGQYPDQNQIADYLRPEAAPASVRAKTTQQPAKAMAPVDDDFIPF